MGGPAPTREGEEKKKEKDIDRGERFYLRLEQAGPVGRTLNSVAEEEGWTRAQALRAVEFAREVFDDAITYAPDSRTFYVSR